MNKIDFVVQSIKGENRSFNQDHIEVFKINNFHLFMVFDGVSSMSNSYRFIRNFIESFKSELNKFDEYELNFHELLHEAHNKVLEENIEGMSTLSLLLLSESNKIAKYLNIGDSRIYIYNNQFIEKITVDDNLLNKKNILTRSLGMQDLCLDDFCLSNIEPDMNYLICTDGFYNLMEKYLKKYFLAINYKNLRNIARRIHSIQNGKNIDDSSFILIKNVF
ncbi:PP2C family protein-serine/threonine phosphatase [Larkinella humicola]|uniref:PPM-type phosphatase domain-containing protein n=1 Tax=Larkinella humicola TaxID=2607654 RepID=A0A5N1JM53_9BACT|nr:protein phosphatase 2C domain-containing protein [Larkinella humicola]KAA9357284.1 hypothetical protein F0P93_05980 [Larkinella humicola]